MTSKTRSNVHTSTATSRFGYAPANQLKDYTMSYETETEKAISRITEAYYLRLSEAGLGYIFLADPADLERLASAEKHPLWLEFLDRIERQSVTQAFRDAGAAYEALHRTGQAETPEGLNALYLMFTTAPEWLADEFSEMARQMGLIPEPASYAGDGAPMYALTDIANKLGISVQEAERRARQLGVTPSDAMVHRVQ